MRYTSRICNGMIAIDAIDSGSNSSAALVIEALMIVWSKLGLADARLAEHGARAGGGTSGSTPAAAAGPVCRARRSPSHSPAAHRYSGSAAGNCNAAASRARNSLSAAFCATVGIGDADRHFVGVLARFGRSQRTDHVGEVGLLPAARRGTGRQVDAASAPSASASCWIAARSRSSLRPSANAAMSATVSVARVCGVSMCQR